MRKRHETFKSVNFEDLPQEIESRERKVIHADFIIDRDCFRKTAEEKLRLKIEKARYKESLKRHN